MSAVVAGQGGIFLSETGTRSSAVLGAFLSETVSTGVTVDLAGNLAPSVAFGGALIDTEGLAGDLAPSVAFAADLAVAHYVDLAGNLGGVSQYGKLSFGQALYSRNGALTPVFDGDIDIVGQDFFDGDLAPVVSFAGALSILTGISGGDIAPQVTFAADLGVIIGLAGNLPVQVGLGATLTGLVDIHGDLPVNVVLASSELTAGPLWSAAAPCPSPPWTPSEPCPPSLWTPTESCDPAEWEETELCNG